MLRNLFAALLAPLATMIAVPAVTIIFGMFDYDQIITDDVAFSERMEFAFGFGVAATTIAYIVMLLYGWIILIWLHRKGWTTAIHLWKAGVIGGAMPFVLYFGFILVHESWYDRYSFVGRALEMLRSDAAIAVQFILYGAVSGALSALLYWRIAVHHRAVDGAIKSVYDNEERVIR